MQKKQNRVVLDKNTDTVIGEGIVFENALLKGSGVIRIDGKFTGTIDIEGHVILGETGYVSGDIIADSALFAGKFQGNLRIRSALHLTESAVITGKFETGKFIVDEGAVLNGTCNVITAESLLAEERASSGKVRSDIKTGGELESVAT